MSGPKVGDFVQIHCPKLIPGEIPKRYKKAFIWSGVVLSVRPTRTIPDIEFEIYAHGKSIWFSNTGYGFEILSTAK